MKKLFFAALLSTGIATTTHAQQGAHIGLHGLINSVWIINQESYGQEEYDYKLKMAVGGGLVVGYNFSNHIGLQAQLDLLKMGQNYQSSKGANLARQYNLSYIGVPLLLKYTSGEGNVRFYGQIGPQFNFLSKAVLVFSDTAGKTIGTVAATNRFEKTDIGLNFGLGANITLTPALYLNAGLSFYYGFTDINDPAWRIPRLSNGKYKPSHNGIAGADIGIHYLFLKGS